MSKKKLIVIQVASSSRLAGKRRASLKGLGLGRIWRARELEDTKAVRGMVHTVRDVVRIVEDDYFSSETQKRGWKTRVRLSERNLGEGFSFSALKMAGVVVTQPAPNPFKPISKPTSDDEKK